MWTEVWLSVETFVLVHEGRLRGISGPVHRDDIDAIEVIAMPFWDYGRVAAMSIEEHANYVFDEFVLPSDEDEAVAVERLLEGDL